MYKFTITYTCSITVPVGADLIKRTAVVCGNTVADAKDKVEELDNDYYCIDTVFSEEIAESPREIIEKFAKQLKDKVVGKCHDCLYPLYNKIDETIEEFLK